MAELLSSHCQYRIAASTVHRYLSGRLPAPRHFIENLHTLANLTSGDRAAIKPLSHYLALRQAAEKTDCSSCRALRQQVSTLEEKVTALEDECAHTRTETVSLRLPAKGPQSPSGAGHAAVRGGSEPAAHLPVPPDKGDRQRTASDVAAARQLAQRAAELLAEDESSALGLLHGTTDVLTPLESAASLVLLRQQHDQLADAFIQIYGREQSERAVMSVALQLHEYGMPDDAGAVLRAAVR
ncbi:hypothetical protein SMD11_3670 [Streptomyces albireticuli]|uniref:Uncharacterized protein n=1 Tax=Streptomyces albireticuli TaxID=1940 RepID=A0A1Z2L4S2_9ACTN|nr:hypothetical protein [Streptomyces albireticuli]ARZ69295.1 hypothetical protein SMD11_3670 [Streptomyces albireticuli]